MCIRDRNGLLDFDNVGFGARDDARNPQLAGVESLVKGRLGSRGVQEARLNVFTTVPVLKPYGFPGSPDALLTFTVTEPDELVRRRFRISFTSPTTYAVSEGIVGTSTGLTRGVLTDNRAQFPSLAGTLFPMLNPNTAQTTLLPVSESLGTPLSVTLADPSADLYTFASVGDPYRVEWPATPSTGSVGVGYSPTKLDGDPHGFTWTVSGTGFSSGDTYFVDVFRNVDMLILDDDEIPVLVPSDLVVNIRNAF